LPRGKDPTVPIDEEAGRASEPVFIQRLEEKSFASAGDRTPFIQFVVRHYTDSATPSHIAFREKAEKFLDYLNILQC
jgi:hypothetical protein